MNELDVFMDALEKALHSDRRTASAVRAARRAVEASRAKPQPQPNDYTVLAIKNP